jgi:tetratricopeptide (TPR) repeat protein
MNHPDQGLPQGMEELLQQAVGRILRRADFEAFLTWMHEAVPSAVSADEGLSDHDEGRLAMLLGRALWAAVPRPELDFRPIPAPQPAAEQPCPCDSGLPYRDCCGVEADWPELPAELVWGLLLNELSDAQLQHALSLRAVPETLLAAVADRWLANDRPGKAAALLERLFAGDIGDLDERFEPALDILCDAYDVLDHWKKKQAFLKRVTEDGSAALKAAAWQRLSVMSIDEGEFESAFDAFRLAQRHAPDSPGTALLEITLLAAQHRDDHARARALFWLHKLRRSGDGERGVLAFLEAAARDPQDALVSSHAAALDPPLLRLRAWIERASVRSVPVLRVAFLDDALEGPEGGQLPLFEHDALPLPAQSCPGTHFGALLPPSRIGVLERAWHRLFPCGKPYSTGLAADDDGRLWRETNWLDFLESNPEAADSPDILDDVATALYDHPESSLPWVERVLMLPILERVEEMLRRTLALSPVEKLPWGDQRNRPMLRLLFRLYLLRAESGERRAAAELLELLLSLNPRDNHGVRAELMNHYLRNGEDERALALARQFPTDILADLAYGEVLALYRLGQQERAASALHEAVGRLPRIPRFLVRKRIKRPVLSTDGFTAGGDDQAWLYREAMRDVWAAEPGLLAWVKKQTV